MTVAAASLEMPERSYMSVHERPVEAAAERTSLRMASWGLRRCSERVVLAKRWRKMPSMP